MRLLRRAPDSMMRGSRPSRSLPIVRDSARLCAVLAVVLAAFAAPAWAQYKWVDENGQASYGDQPPKDARKVERLDGVASAQQSDDPLSILPFEIQRAAKNLPVVLYARSDCPACVDARALLRGHSVPYVERTIATQEDIEAFHRMGGQDMLPVVSIGHELLRGFNLTMWNDALAVAGYPQGVPMPQGWKWPEPKPLAPPPVQDNNGAAPDGGDTGQSANPGDSASAPPP